MTRSGTPLPRGPRRGQERNLARRVTGGRRALGPRVPRESQKDCAGNQRQRCRCNPDELACRQRWQSLAPPLSRPATQLAGNHGKSRSAMRPLRDPQPDPGSQAFRTRTRRSPSLLVALRAAPPSWKTPQETLKRPRAPMHRGLSPTTSWCRRISNGCTSSSLRQRASQKSPTICEGRGGVAGAGAQAAAKGAAFRLTCYY